MDADAIIKKNKNVYDKISDQFAQTRKFLWDELKPLADYAKPGSRVLDLGCGTGRLYQLFEKFQPMQSLDSQGMDIEQILYTGVDNSVAQITVARKQYPATTFDVGEMTALSYDDNSFDVIYAIASFHHLADKETRIKALKEMQRVLVAGGILVMTNWNLTGEWGVQKVAKGYYQDVGDGNYIVPWKNSNGVVIGERFYHSFGKEEMTALLEGVGFILQEQYFTKHGEKTNHAEGMNLVSVAVAQ